VHEEILSIGCGPKKEGTINVDINPAVEPDVVCDGNFLPFKSKTFDKCILSHVLEHMLNPNQLMSESYRILKENGLIFVSFPNFASFTVLLEWLTKKPAYSDDLLFGGREERTRWQWQWHKQLCTAATVKTLLQRHRFGVRKIIGHPPSTGPRVMQLLGKILVRIFPERAGNMTIIGRK